MMLIHKPVMLLSRISFDEGKALAMEG